MIYQIYNNDVPTATQENAVIICWSTDGTYALVSSDVPLTSINVIDQFDNSELHSLLVLPLWQQPCPAC